MIGRIALLVCIAAAMFIATESKPLHSQHKALHKNVARSVLQLKLTKTDISRGISIQISAKPMVRKDMEFVHRMPKPVDQRRDRIHRRKHRKSQSHKKALAVAKKNEKEAVLKVAMKSNEKTVLMRSKRSVQEKEMADKKDTQIEDLHKFNDDNSAESDDYSSEEEEEKPSRRSNLRRGSSSHRMQEQQKQLKFINSEDYRDYAFDTTDNEVINEDDDFLQQYYGTKMTRDVDNTHNTANSNDFTSFTDILHSSANERDDRFTRKLHYGENQDNIPNDKYDGGDNEDVDDNDDSDGIYDEYESYDDDDY
ncbi:protein PFC0760c-like [Sitodiplosis mosellana]|uniref:protein PFC0760c-like n=1 Tax=Sitodiplosis mosellana TaxID=263140 RepID=UPI00244421E9|nr:protein PFC0760c-like [Sitodiplosis mosellana]